MSGKSAAGKRKVFVKEIRGTASKIPLVMTQMEERNVLPTLGKEAPRGQSGQIKFGVRYLRHHINAVN